ncbi:MAG: hypothetical protein ICV87_05650 [Gemmatimonadetes bacterium]|nr:hypothetical protein [Gemmatimonadota bacterium]
MTSLPRLNRPKLLAVLMLPAIGWLGACADQITAPAVAPQLNQVELPSEKTTVCKVGPAGTYSFTMNWNAGDVAYAGAKPLVGSSFTLNAGSCIDVFEGGQGGTVDVGVSEVDLADGVVLDSITVKRKGGECAVDAKYCAVTYKGVNKVTVESNWWLGFVITFYNSTRPPALQLTKVADAATVNAGNPIGFRMEVRSTGLGAAKGVTLSDPLPGGTGINWYIASSDPSCTINGTAPSQTLSCVFGDMAPGTMRSVQVMSETTLQTCAEFPNTASAQATNHAQVQASATTKVTCATRPLVGCTPGFWQGRNNGAHLWNTQPDAEWTANGGTGAPPFVHTTAFNSFFTSHPALAGKTMMDLVGTGGGSVNAQKAARSLVAAYLNTAVGLNTGYATSNLAQRWTAAVGAGDAALLALHTELDAANNAGTCGLTANRGK